MLFLKTICNLKMRLGTAPRTPSRPLQQVAGHLRLFVDSILDSTVRWIDYSFNYLTKRDIHLLPFNSTVIVDVGAATCINAIFKIAATAKIARNWDIKVTFYLSSKSFSHLSVFYSTQVTQYDCGDQNGGTTFHH